MVYFNLDYAVQCMKTIVDSHKCVACDKLDGPFVRYPCGHPICRSCVESAEDCLLCLTPPPISTHHVDEPLSLRTEHVSKLLVSFQELFKINVYRQVRLSEQQKLENQVFPTSIQASSKYCNKRKSLNISIADKENITPFLPGENISYCHYNKMDSTIENVQRWLRNNDTNLKESINLPRKPFADLNVNRLSKSKTLGRLKDNKASNKKQTQRRKTLSTKKLQFLKQEDHTHTNSSILDKKNEIRDSDNFKDVIVIDESQIINKDNNTNFIDEDVIEIDDSQRDSIDKDKLAWLSVLREAEKPQSNVTDNISFNRMYNCSSSIKAQNLDAYKVPFYKRGVLYETCNLCKKDQIAKGCNSTKVNNSNNVTVGVKSEAYEAFIKISDCVDVKVINKESVAVQTDIVNYEDELEVNLQNHSKSVIVEESETESESGNQSGKILEVVAEVHRSEPYINRRVLSTLEPREYVIRSRNSIRGRTPLSTDSSDKENFDPNRAKKRRLSKKCNKKK